MVIVIVEADHHFILPFIRYRKGDFQLRQFDVFLDFAKKRVVFSSWNASCVLIYLS